jgi:rhamnogalacturonyl hydrolase YesR
LLAGVYGHTLNPVVYTQGMAIDARLQLARLDPTAPNPATDITQLVEPYLSGATQPFSADAGSATLGGFIWGPELADATGDRRYADLVVQIAERYRPAPDGGAPLPSDPAFRTEDMAMNGMLLGRAFQLTGNTRYLELLTPFLLQARIQQDDGLFWHCRTAPYYWGRGNGFGAIGYCETLSFLPDDHPDRQALLDIHLRHLYALRHCQLPSGLYPQVLNIPGSYPEFTVTCMLGYVMARGLRRGWLDTSFRASVDLAWQGVTERIDDQGGIVDACTNTGVQDSRRDYLDRPAIFGRDDRSGSMALWFALELSRLQRDTEP